MAWPTPPIRAIARIDDPSKARVLLYQMNEPVHAPLNALGLGGGAGGGIEEAPADHEYYARRDAAWAQLGTAAPRDLHVGSTAPPGPTPDDLWVDMTAVAGTSIHVGPTPPSSPAINDLWVDTT